ncbi:chorismate mutase [Kiloniella antarctica]|uniref:chorismate mutase n=1 Tax=Kiloniella antarctica TaxID=1550907 RepID=A0ABW5BEC1_9PROT
MSDKDTLSDLRNQIDEIDIQLHDLLMKRTEVVQIIGARKGDAVKNLSAGREAQVLRRMVERHKGPLPKSALVRFWREIFASAAQLEGGITVTVHAPENDNRFYDLAREHFGMETPISSRQTVLSVLREVTDGQASVGVLPLPQEEDNPWWLSLAQGEGATKTRIIARLPFFNTANSDGSEAVIVASNVQEKTGHDRSYVVVESSEPLSRSTLIELLEKSNLKPLNIQIHTPDGSVCLQLIEVDDYVAPGDERLALLTDLSDKRITHAWAIGGYAIPLTDA